MPDEGSEVAGGSTTAGDDVQDALARVRGAVTGGCRHSFATGTAVVMADGTTRPIEEVEVGDKVLATDPETGETTSKEVVATHVNLDEDLAEVTVYDPGTGETAVLNTTQHHPLWNASDRTWSDAEDLESGDRLATLGPRAPPAVAAVKTWYGAVQMYDLTVADIHTYYVIAGDAPVLVHNCGPEPGPAPAGSTLEDYRQANLGKNAPRFVTEYTSPNGNRYYGRTTPGGVDIEPGSVLDDVLRGRHTGCSEVCALNEAQKAGDEIFGGTFRTLKVNSGELVDPCKDYCQPMIYRLFGTWMTR